MTHGMNISSMTHALARAAVLAILLLGTMTVQASVVIHSTRIIYPQHEREVTVRLDSRNQAPVLAQVWLDSGDEQATPEQATTAFVATPPIFRMEPGKQQVVRLAYTGETLPSPQERLFWFNLLEVPSHPQGAPQRNQLQIAFRTRIKLLLRPANLPYPVEAAPAQLQWRHVSTVRGQGLEVFNPTPYYMTFEHIELLEGGQRHARRTVPSNSENLVPPGGRGHFELPTLKSPPSTATTVAFQTLDDFGVRVAHSAEIKP
jgi:chaperone protein EcpD